MARLDTKVTQARVQAALDRILAKHLTRYRFPLHRESSTKSPPKSTRRLGRKRMYNNKSVSSSRSRAEFKCRQCKIATRLNLWRLIKKRWQEEPRCQDPVRVQRGCRRVPVRRAMRDV